jgi:general secretion pathway protein A
MYVPFFGLAEKPFAITPDPRYLFLGERHADALAHLVYGITDAGGFIQLTGEVGTGKTTTVRSLLARAPANAEIALIVNPRLTPQEFLESLCAELGVPLPQGATGTREIVERLNARLLEAHAAGRRVVLIVDEAQNLTPEVLEQVRLLTNLETESQKLLQIILIGQHELREVLARNELRQLAQRVTARFHLEPLAPAETVAYVRHRMRVAGARNEVFTRGALRELHRLSGGVPRLINIIADRALLGAYTEEALQVDAALVRRAAAEVFGRRVLPGWLWPALAGVAALLLLAVTMVAWRSPHGGALLHAAAGQVPAGAAAAGAAPPPPPPTLAQLLATTPTIAGEGYDALFAAWGASFDPAGAEACAQAEAQGLACSALHGSLAQLAALRRPALLRLEVAGATRSVLLAGLGDTQALLRIGAREVRVPLAELAAHWYGDCLLLWRSAALPVGEIRPGMRGAAVRTLRSQLLEAAGQAVPRDPASQYDTALAQLVRDFQQAHHLAVDGIAGAETQLVLDAVLAAPGSPRLAGAN